MKNIATHFEPARTLELNFRQAQEKDLPAIIKMLATDKLGQAREHYKEPLPASYTTAFKSINADPNQELIVVEINSEEIIGTLQLSLIPYLTYKGGIRGQIEAVRVNENYRGKGVGKALFIWAINRAKQKGAHLVQLTTDKARPEALKFYENLGFKYSHAGMKLHFKK